MGRRPRDEVAETTSSIQLARMGGRNSEQGHPCLWVPLGTLLRTGPECPRVYCHTHGPPSMNVAPARKTHALPRSLPLGKHTHRVLKRVGTEQMSSVSTCAMRVHVCLEKTSPLHMLGSHMFKIQAHFSEVISGKMLNLLTAIKGKHCLSQHKCLSGTRSRRAGIFV